MSDNARPPLAHPWPCRMRWLTPDEAFVEFRRFCQELFAINAVAAERSIRPDTTLAELDAMNPEADWVDLFTHFGIRPSREWLLGFQVTDTVAVVCEDLARQVEVPVVEPVTILGRKCKTAGVFLTLERMLAADGADVSDLAPSSSLLPYVRCHPDVFTRLLLAYPGRLRRLSVTSTSMCLGCLLMLFAPLTAVAGVCIPKYWWAASCFAVGLTLTLISSVLFLAALIWRSRLDDVMSYGHGVFHDFRDLIHALLGRERRAKTA